MKKSLQLFVLAVLMLAASSCELVKDLVVANIPGVSTIDYTIKEPAGTETFDKVQVVNMGNPDYAKHKEHVNGFEINSITAQVQKYSGSESHLVSDLKLYYAPQGTNDYIQLGTIENLDLHIMATKEKIEYINFVDKANNEAKLKDMILNDQKISFKLTGLNASEKPIDTTIRFRMDANLVVGLKEKN
ncbi:hypothetical protein FVR03_21810 [Pontibacter qinzhouensis]|uniref:Uncharacterized protein n=1 Tax=Pontibacter qinzhouensis TaxID=2603253 RepID=A0A5C8IZ90_9BACT|nr:hypothetical protein [Pontibacter qinzhouensis]TXK26426.1 hypothetical protein FVR03_21810 [Pontibacter qinzhouensis]